MSSRAQTGFQGTNPQGAQRDSYNGSPANAQSIYTMRSQLRNREGELRRCQADLKKEKHRYRSLEGTKNKLQLDNRALKSENEVLNSDLSHLKGIDEDIYYIADNYIRPYAQKRGHKLRDDTLASYDAVLKPMLRDALQAHFQRNDVQALQSSAQVTETEVRALRTRLMEMQNSHNQTQVLQDQVKSLQDEVQSLQKQLLHNIERVCVISDDVFAKDFRSLVAKVKSLSRSAQITHDTNMQEALDSRGLLLGVDNHHWSTRARKKAFMEAWIWSVLIERIFETPFTILGDNGAAIADVWSKLFDNKSHRGWPTPSALCESWRCTTVEHAIEGMDPGSVQREDDKAERSHSDGTAPQGSENVELQMRNSVANEIGTRLANLSTAADFPLIPKVVEAAFALALQMSLQRYRLQITFPNVHDRFDRVQMSPISNSDGEDLEDGTVAFIVRPGLTKWGDAHGKHFDQRYDIVPCLVQLLPYAEEVNIKSEPM